MNWDVFCSKPLQDDPRYIALRKRVLATLWEDPAT